LSGENQITPWSSLLLSSLYPERPGAELDSSGLMLKVMPYELPLSEKTW